MNGGDAFAPLYHVPTSIPPICIITGERKTEWKNRVEESLLLDVSLCNLRHPLVELREFADKDHGTVVTGSWFIFPEFIEKALAAEKRN